MGAFNPLASDETAHDLSGQLQGFYNVFDLA